MTKASEQSKPKVKVEFIEPWRRQGMESCFNCEAVHKFLAEHPNLTLSDMKIVPITTAYGGTAGLWIFYEAELDAGK